METLQRLSRRQVDALRYILLRETPTRGVPLSEIARGLGVRPPSALGHVTALEKLGLVQRYRGKTQLSPKGRRTMVEYQRHHRIAESLFGRLGLPTSEVCAAAREVDLALSHRTVEQICRVARHPTACPHGEEIGPCSDPRGSS